jgi:hypothetical protein
MRVKSPKIADGSQQKTALCRHSLGVGRHIINRQYAMHIRYETRSAKSVSVAIQISVTA